MNQRGSKGHRTELSIHALAVVAPSKQMVRTVILKEGQWMTIGRGPGFDIPVDDSAVSRPHARVRLSDNRLVVEDLKSLNGTIKLSPDEREQRLEPGRPTELGAGSALKIGDSRLVPCEWVGEDVLLSVNEIFQSVPPAVDLDTLGATTPPQSPPSRAEAIVRSLRLPYDGDPWRWVLNGLVELTGSVRGFLLVPIEDTFRLQASRGVDGPVCLSKRFLRETASRKEAWSVVTGPNLPEDLRSRSLAEYAPEVRLAGVPLLDGDGRVAALACLEGQGQSELDGVSLDAFAVAMSPMIDLAGSLDREVRRREALEYRGPAQSSSPSDSAFEGSRLIGRNPAFLGAVEVVRRAAPTRAVILIRGPSGSGKDLLAQFLHMNSPRREQPFCVRNAAALPENLVESELFGHDRGAFTGAERTSPGAFERAHEGTLFLDEIGDLSLAAQAKILRVIETGEVIRVGGSRRHVDVRLVTATHRDLSQMVKEGRFREDLFYRLRVIEVTLPALAERVDDLPDLIEHFLHQFRRPDGERVQGISPEALRALTLYPWPGNIRELRNLIERGVVLDRDGLIDLDDLPSEIREGIGSVDRHGSELAFLALPWTDARKEFERRYFEEALRRNGGRVGETAMQIRVDRKTVSNKIREYGLKGDDSV